MALVNCQECGAEISKKAKTCPKCGAPKGPKQYSLGKLFILIIFGVFLYSLFSNNSKQTRDTRATPPAHQTQGIPTNLPAHVLVSQTSLAPKNGGRIEIHVSNENLSREQCKNIINAYRKKAGPEGQVSVHKPSSLLDNSMSPWCIDNMGLDDKGIFFNDSFFEKTKQTQDVKNPIKTEGVVSNKFKLSHDKTKSGIDLMLDTDLPMDTVISVTAARSYWEKGTNAEYERSYYEFKGKLGDWQDNSSVNLDPSKWRKSLKDHQAEMKKVGLGFEVDKISDLVTIRAVVPINGQTNPLFGSRNSNLSGTAVSIESYGRLIEHEIQINMPL